MAEKTSKAKKPVEKKKSGAGKFFLGAAIGAIAGAIAGKMLSRDENDECDCGDDCECKKVTKDEPAKTAKTTVKATKAKTTTKAAKTTAKATKTATTKAAATKKTTKTTK